MPNNIFQIAASVGTPLGLVGMIVVAAFYAYALTLKSQKETLEKLPVKDRSKAIDGYLSRYGIDGEGLSPEQKFELFKAEMEKRYSFYIRIISILSAVFVICFIVGVGGWAYARNRAPNGGPPQPPGPVTFFLPVQATDNASVQHHVSPDSASMIRNTSLALRSRAAADQRVLMIEQRGEFAENTANFTRQISFDSNALVVDGEAYLVAATPDQSNGTGYRSVRLPKDNIGRLTGTVVVPAPSKDEFLIFFLVVEKNDPKHPETFPDHTMSSYGFFLK